MHPGVFACEAKLNACYAKSAASSVVNVRPEPEISFESAREACGVEGVFAPRLPVYAVPVVSFAAIIASGDWRAAAAQHLPQPPDFAPPNSAHRAAG